MYVPRREEVVEVLADAGMLPAIYFVFSRAGCDRSVQWLRSAGVRLTTREEAERIREFAEMRAAWMDEQDLVTLGFYDFLDGLTQGVAAHHAGMLPGLQGDRRGAVRGRPGEGGVRHRDALARASTCRRAAW